MPCRVTRTWRTRSGRVPSWAGPLIAVSPSLSAHHDGDVGVAVARDLELDGGTAGQRRGLDESAHEVTTGERRSEKASAVKGLAMRPSAPAAAACSRISSEPSDVTKQNGVES